MPILDNPRHEQFASLVASGMRNKQAAISLGYSLQSASVQGSRLAGHDKIRQRIAELQRSMAARRVNHSIAVKDDRVKAQQARWDKMHRVIEARASDPSMKIAAGGDTGLLVRKIKSVGAGPMAHEVEEFEVDVGLLTEIRKHEEHVAHELGQWVESTPTDSGVRALMSFGDVTVNIIGTNPSGSSQAAGGDQAQVIEAIAEEVVDVSSLRGR